MPKIYSNKLKRHYQNPQNTGKLAGYTHTAEQLNPLCGDEIIVYLKVKHGLIKDIRYEARGCMIAIASASALSEKIKTNELSLNAVKKYSLSEIEKLLETKIPAGRAPCALLVLDALKKI